MGSNAGEFGGVMTLLEKAQEIIDKYDNPHFMHYELDRLMEDILISYGHIELINLIREQKRWYWKER